jgi:hypothetical protein
MKINSASQGIKIEGHRGTWYVIDTTINNTIKCFLLEHEQYGEDAAHIIVREDGSIIVDDVYNGFGDLPDIVYR